MLFDVHCHLNDRRFREDLDAVVGRAKSAGVRVINSTIEAGEIDDAIAFCRKYDNVHLTIGCSPTEEGDRAIEEIMSRIKENKHRIVGIGEVGLDYYWVKEQEKREKQKENFRKFMELSIDLGLPLVVHSRESNKDVLDILKEYGKPALMHCFSGTAHEAKEFINLGCLISIPTSVVHSKSRQETARHTPLENITLETDAPYMPPQPKTRNEPANVKLCALKIAETKGVEESAVESATTKNAIKFFGM